MIAGDRVERERLLDELAEVVDRLEQLDATVREYDPAGDLDVVSLREVVSGARRRLARLTVALDES